jgi:hypothetical protein
MSRASQKVVSRQRALDILETRLSKLQKLARENDLDLSDDALRTQLRSILIGRLERGHTIAEDAIIEILRNAHATSADTALTTGEIKRKLRLSITPLTILNLMAERGELMSSKGGRPFQLIRDDASGKLLGGESARNLLDSRIESLAELANRSPEVRRLLRRQGKGLTRFDAANLRHLADLETYNMWVEELHRNGLGRSLKALSPIWLRTSSKWWLPES